jgi:hypothetical protein
MTAPAISPRDLLAQAQRELAMGHFLRATAISRRAGKLVDRIQELHGQFIELLRKAMEKTDTMDDMGYDVTEARALIRSARDMAMKSDYDSALTKIKGIKRTLNRATYLPFPLLNKNVDIISTAFWDGSALQYTVKIENPSSEPLGEIIIRPFFEDGAFHDVPERHYGNIGPRYWYESTFRLVPKGKQFNIGIDSTILKEESVVFRTKFSSRHGKAAYTITVENNSDQIIRDIGLVPRPPGGLVPDPASVAIEYIEPFGSRTAEFALSPAVLEKTVPLEAIEEPQVSPKAKERVVLLEGTEDFTIMEEAEEEKPHPAPKKPVVLAREIDEEADDWGEKDIGDGEAKRTPADFTPQDEDYDLMLMSPYAYPDSAPGRIAKGAKRGTTQDREMEESV